MGRSPSDLRWSSPSSGGSRHLLMLAADWRPSRFLLSYFIEWVEPNDHASVHLLLWKQGFSGSTPAMGHMRPKVSVQQANIACILLVTFSVVTFP